MPDIFDTPAGAGNAAHRPWFLQFTQDYGDRLTVEKKGLDATAMVIKKYAIAEDKVVTFSNHVGRRRALTVFHFHPAFPSALRHDYMESHAEGRDLAREVVDHAADLRDQRLAGWKVQARKIGTGAALTAQALAIYLIAHWPETR